MRKTSMTLMSALAFFFLQSNHLFAQEKREAATLFGNADSLSLKDIGFFVSPGIGFTQIDADGASLFQLRAGLSARDQWSAGGFMNVSMNHIYPVSETLSDVYMDFWSAGAFLEYTLLSKKVLHVTFPLFVGYGEVEMDGKADNYPELGEANFLLAEPSAQLELNLHRNVRLNTGVGYRWVSNMNYRNFDQNAVSGFTITAGLKIGIFR